MERKDVLKSRMDDLTRRLLPRRAEIGGEVFLEVADQLEKMQASGEEHPASMAVLTDFLDNRLPAQKFPDRWRAAMETPPPPATTFTHWPKASKTAIPYSSWAPRFPEPRQARR